MNLKSTLLSSAVLLALTACGSSNDDSPITPTDPQKSTFSLGISDAPVTGLKAVNVVFDSITLRSQGGEDFSFETREASDSTKAEMVNLLEYTGDDVFGLLEGEDVPAGEYSWIRADVINGDINNLTETSHVVYEDDSTAPLIVNRKGNDGIGEIQLDGFTLNQTDNTFVLEFDLKKSLVAPQNGDEIVLKPRGVRLENLAESQDIRGTTSESLFANCETDNIDVAAEDGSFGHAVYLYNSDVEVPRDNYEVNEDETPVDAPLATANVELNAQTSQYEFELAFITPGDYQLGYTCNAHIDDAELQDEAFTLYQVKPVAVIAGEDTEVTFDIAQ
ncbi:MAG: DUF4382 domain-containing protein [Pseudomonadota bacterium]|uniref:DUF4382 domain-containing protein n=1 Tax=unclassified Pseudoalteromonas TaxID=194690 RepID=UPI00048B0CC1|nr:MULTISPECIES: DUF4382 domain-containing protein [unclassified Pseudoalteromonas]KGK02074.1 protein of unknown function DUF4382 [Pseudoalteromonas sp. ND6B]SFT62718.1 protein of unknown function [Pseudoalteromonas sp. DSM 26666]